MPIIPPNDSTAPVFYPKSDYQICRYLDLSKFISLIQRKSLFFCRVDRLEDRFEGPVARMNYELRYNWVSEGNDKREKPATEEELKQEVENLYVFDNKMKCLHCINCWNKYINESAALWKIYSDFNKGIMVKSSISKLENALKNSPEAIDLSEIRYLNYKNERMLDGNTNYLFIHKQKAYSYEEEVRLICQKMPENGWVYDWSKEEVQEGVYVQIEIDTLIDEIVIAPYSQNWYVELIQDICDKYGCKKKVSKSEMI